MRGIRNRGVADKLIGWIVVLGLGFAASAMGKDVMLMNRIGPSQSELFVASPDGSGEHKLLPTSGFDYHPSYSYDGKWIVFTSEKSGYGQADVYRVHPDASGLERLTDDPALDDQGVLSPDDTHLAFVSTRGTHRANIWILDLITKQLRNLTGQPGIQGDPIKPDAFLRPAWSPDGQWIAFTSDRNTEWTDHGNHTGWEHLQELRVYIVHPDGTGLRPITGPGICSGSPKWSADSKQLVFSEMEIETTWDARIFFLSARATSQIVSIDLKTGKRTQQTSGPGLKLMPQFLPDGRIGFLTKTGKNEGVGYTNGQGSFASKLGANEGVAYTSGEPKFPGSLRSPAWSPGGKQVVFEKVDYPPRPQNQLMYSWDPKYEYRYTDVFPSFSKDGTLLITNKDVDSSLVTMKADGSNKKVVYKAVDGAAFAPAWSPDGQWIVFGFGSFLQSRRTGGAKIMMVRRDGTELQELTSGMPNAGFPSWSADGTEIVFRSWGGRFDGPANSQPQEQSKSRAHEWPR